MGNLAGKAERSGRHAQRVIVGQSTEIKTKDSEPPEEMGRRAVELILLVLAGLRSPLPFDSLSRAWHSALASIRF